MSLYDGEDRRPRRGSRRTGTNPRAMLTNPRAMGSNPSAGTPADVARVRRLLDRCYAMLHIIGIFACEECADERWRSAAPCHCRVISSRCAGDLVNRYASAIEAGRVPIGHPWYTDAIRRRLDRDADP